ncbi:translation initiation factor eIF3 subunit [Wallemia mellicola]|uniref:Eukaryotic translation initiation factor 3 30 kDa subunit n=2 Tax=Wallemia mellicola TaxID=1708541 RepID=A0A4T0U4C6_9BASI|nr:translation initiation factor eIF3 subunit [Wallemia mellicola CBS 633.66]TIB82405.1 translation initiation factor eIF3 subunit [Wallemia mellicola]EIM23146.1 translation initiation factor eIF3 subunit [Wallemia mellicola CBS 633.66]TIB87358.1 translation initiation factor eIF3 subunit [Wallemia mellicola]TIB98300.1 translation initiation factor eIF3 subunit [Wallemia mellicola]TIC06549.1 translation initiation factor eIF3 subunit [Wallemia mellicola]|eukprot:XP_006956544.1 translation initiation factor eIF3 subunit [Wallemia mellicola CBS 633.66]
MDDWDASSSDEQPQKVAPVSAPAPARKGKWDDEDEDDKVEDSWDAPSEDEEKKKPAPTPAKKAPAAAPPKKKGTLKQKLEQKEKERKERMDKEGEIDDGDAIDWLEKQRAERQAAKEKEIASDLANAADLFAGMNVAPSTSQTLKKKPTKLAEFQQLAGAVQEVYFKPHASNPQYQQYVTTIVKNLADSLKENEIKGLATRLNTIAAEKARANKAAAAKNKKTKPSLGGGHTTSGTRLDTNIYDEALDDGDDDDLEFM